MRKAPAELIHTFCYISDVMILTKWQTAIVVKCLLVYMILDVKSVILIRLRHKSMPAFFMDHFVSLVLEKQLPSIIVWSRGLISGAEGFLRKALFPL